MDISLLLTSLAGQGRLPDGSGGNPGRSTEASGFAEALAALGVPSAPGEPSTALAGLAASVADQASLTTMMQALSHGTGEGPLAEGGLNDGPLAEIAERLALMASAGELTPEDAGTLAALADGAGREALGADLAVTAQAPGDLYANAPGPMAAVAAEPARATLDARSDTTGSVALLGATLRGGIGMAVQESGIIPAANANGESASSTQRPTNLADVLPQSLVRNGDAPQVPGEPRGDARGEWRGDGMAGLNGTAPGNGAAAAQVPGEPRGDARGEWRGDGMAGLNGTAPGNGAAAAQASPTQGSLAAPLASPAWPGQLGQQLVMLGQRGGEQRVELHLNPAELGPLTISLKMSEQGAQAQFLSAHAPVRQAVEQAIPQLREALAEQGISLGETSVGEHRQQGQSERQALAGGAGTPGAAIDSEQLESAGSAAPLSAQPLEAGRVDLYA